MPVTISLVPYHQNKMHSLTAAVLLVAVAYASASAYLAGHGSARGALEGALGGQWIPDVPVAPAAHIAAPIAAPFFGAAGLGLAGPAALGWGAAGVGYGAGLGHASARGALEGALGGQWIPDVPVGHGK